MCFCVWRNKRFKSNWDVWISVILRRLDGKVRLQKMGEYKFFWMGCVKRIHVVGLLVTDKWIKKVLHGSEACEQETVGGEGNIVERTVLNLISAQAG